MQSALGNRLPTDFRAVFPYLVNEKLHMAVEIHVAMLEGRHYY